MTDRSDTKTGQLAAMPLRVTLERGDTLELDRRFTASCLIGRADQCEIQLTNPLVSRVHAELSFRDGAWWVRDLESKHGTYLDGRRVESARIERRAQLRLGTAGPVLRLTVEEARSGKPAAASGTQTDSLQHYIEHYLKAGDDPGAGEHTVMIRRAFATVKKKHRRSLLWLAAPALGILAALGIYALVQHARINQQRFDITWQELQLKRQQEAAAKFFYEMKAVDVQIAQLRTVLEETNNARLSDQLRDLEKSRIRMSERYEGFVEELGVYRKLNPDERAIYRVARAFNESEFEMPGGFVHAVQRTIRGYWQSRSGRERFLRGVQRATAAGYVPHIASTLQHYGLPPQFFYMALQESNFNPKAVGPLTRWGRAKGMWQFIPSTAKRFGLFPGPAADDGTIDLQDERLDYRKATDAAARYLSSIYGTLAQASGLLVVASYNWGEHRVVNKLEQLAGPQAIPKEALEGIPEDPTARSYWRFLGEYKDRMPDETKDYVLKIVSAAVIGEDPRQFGFDIDNPLEPYMERRDTGRARR